jgi:hypothetical protein
VKTIMKSSPDVENIGQESLFLITKVSQVSCRNLKVYRCFVASGPSENHHEEFSRCGEYRPGEPLPHHQGESAVGTLRFNDVLLPLARVKTIMKSSPDVENIGQESLFLLTKVSQL